MQPKGVEGANITRADQYESGYDELAFVAISQLVGDEAASCWLMPRELDNTIRQCGAQLKSGADSEAAQGFINFPEGPAAYAIVER
ncbi:hypothetical protein [Bradyrhizobium cenepequi]|uniref:hypothetical protein n=1 Tax=Bradyrhizobium cenepequi TaxID=2821403 RepID=UPI001CE29164|nr:hypothetical protein [Bradyrhizobium cenepequi]MCA6108022.1 hypothetical protein [Bradyrhizobium cenepequi]